MIWVVDYENIVEENLFCVVVSSFEKRDTLYLIYEFLFTNHFPRPHNLLAHIFAVVGFFLLLSSFYFVSRHFYPLHIKTHKSSSLDFARIRSQVNYDSFALCVCFLYVSFSIFYLIPIFSSAFELVQFFMLLYFSFFPLQLYNNAMRLYFLCAVLFVLFIFFPFKTSL